MNCHKCGSTDNLESINPYTNSMFICAKCKKKKKVQVSMLHKSRKREEWDKLAAEINGRIAKRGNYTQSGSSRYGELKDV